MPETNGHLGVTAEDAIHCGLTDLAGQAGKELALPFERRQRFAQLCEYGLSLVRQSQLMAILPGGQSMAYREINCTVECGLIPYDDLTRICDSFKGAQEDSLALPRAHCPIEEVKLLPGCLSAAAFL